MKIEPRFTMNQTDGTLMSVATGAILPLGSVVPLELAIIAGTELTDDAQGKMISQITASGASVIGVSVPWALIELPDGTYNEALLAAFRTFLKKLEETQLFVIIVPRCGEDSCVRPVLSGDVFNAEAASSFTAAMMHTARRIKDCTAVIGFSLPPELLDLSAGTAASAFKAAFAEKHGHYFYFADAQRLTGRTKKAAAAERLVLYQMR